MIRIIINKYWSKWIFLFIILSIMSHTKFFSLNIFFTIPFINKILGIIDFTAT
ncbi:hypothetical protein K502DRAFT_263598 [Neoconidiobolus thromboides FSU 785]|nr:hypothetical protein K502DRAFT_263598 [Neoconidiobolus thromboides FSU 785]